MQLSPEQALCLFWAKWPATCQRLLCTALQLGLSAAAGLQVLESRIDHTRVVQIIARADHLPLVKDYLLAVQKANLPAVNEAVNNLLIEEEVGLPPAA